MSEATCNTHTTITVEVAGDRPEYSIRSLCMTAILFSHTYPEKAAEYKAQCRAMVEQYHPASAAAKKFGKHYAWYKATMKKAGELK